MTIVLMAVAGAMAGAATWVVAPWASMARRGTIDQQRCAVPR